MDNKIGSIPEFTQDSPSEEFRKEVPGESPGEATENEVVEEKETPSEPPAEQEPAQEGEDIGDLKEKLRTELRQELLTEISKEKEGLEKAKRDLILELGELRGERRKAKQAEVNEVQEQIDELKDIHPQDVELIEKVLRSKGYVPKASINKMLYDTRKQEEIDKFLEEFREYNDENDPNRDKFGPLLKEVSLYKEPQDPRDYGKILRRAHKELTRDQVPNDRGSSTQAKKQQIKLAGSGAGGSQRSSSVSSFDSKKRQALLDGGWSEEEIKEMEQRQ